MITLEHVEKLREKTGVSFEDAKRALDISDGDMLDAVIWLERQGLLDAPAGGQYTTKPPVVVPDPQDKSGGHARGDSFKRWCAAAWTWCVGMIDKANRNMFEVKRKDAVLIAIPVSVLALLLLFMFHASMVLLVVGLFCGCRYRFVGQDIARDDINSAMDAAANTAEEIRREATNKDA